MGQTLSTESHGPDIFLIILGMANTILTTPLLLVSSLFDNPVFSMRILIKTYLVSLSFILAVYTASRNHLLEKVVTFL